MTNRWQIEELSKSVIVIIREEDNIPICTMSVSVEEGDGLLSYNEAMDVAEQIVENWNSDCTELESPIGN